MRILIVDDSSVLRKLVGKIVERMQDSSIDIVEATTGRDALAMARAQGASLDVMLCDLGMPDMDGLSILRSVKADAATSHVAVVIVTGDMSQDTVSKATAAGAAGFLQKPFRKGELIDIINAVRSRRGKAGGGA